MQVKTAVCEYMKKSNYYVEYLHFNNNSQLDGFLDHKNNMYVEINEYETRKEICDKLNKIYNIHDFLWANQSYTAIANSLFKVMVGYLPESSYNNKTRKILDDYYPKAIQWCSFEDQPNNLVNTDICKQFPSILVHNGITIPIYTIRDCVEKFTGKQEMDNDIGLYCPELNNNGEFYINEYTIKYFDVRLKIEAGFYHVSLIDFLVHELKMPTSNIKYKLITRHGLKSDTFKDFITFVFKNLPESEGKKMCNSFIGELGRKYSRTDYGFSCQDLQTCQDIRTQGLADGKNLTIDKFENVYLIREQNVERILSDHTSINRFVISNSVLQCLKLPKKNWTEYSELYSINTEGFFMTNPKHSYKNKADVKFSVKHIGKPFVTNSKPVYFEKTIS